MDWIQFGFDLDLILRLKFKKKKITRNELALPVMGTIFLVGRAKRAPHWGVQSRFRVIYITYYTSKSGIWLVISRVASYFHEPKASANTAYE